MKMFTLIAALAACGFANDCLAGEQQRGVEFKCVTPCDVLRGTGYFIQDTRKPESKYSQGINYWK